MNNKLPVLFRKRLRLGQVPQLQALGLSQLDSPLNLEHRLTTTIPNVDVDWTMFVAVEEEPVPVFFEDLWHGRTLCNGHSLGERLVFKMELQRPREHGRSLRRSKERKVKSGNQPGMGSAPATGAADCALAVCSRPRPNSF